MLKWVSAFTFLFGSLFFVNLIAYITSSHKKDWIEFDAGSRVELSHPISVTVAEIAPGWSSISPGQTCSIDGLSLKSRYGLQLKVLGKESSPPGHYLVAVGPNDWSHMAKIGFCGASRFFVSQEGLEAIRHAALNQVRLSEQKTNDTMSKRMENVVRIP